MPIWKVHCPLSHTRQKAPLQQRNRNKLTTVGKPPILKSADKDLDFGVPVPAYEYITSVKRLVRKHE